MKCFRIPAFFFYPTSHLAVSCRTPLPPSPWLSRCFPDSASLPLFSPLVVALPPSHPPLHYSTSPAGCVPKWCGASVLSPVVTPPSTHDSPTFASGPCMGRYVLVCLSENCGRYICRHDSAMFTGQEAAPLNQLGVKQSTCLNVKMLSNINRSIHFLFWNFDGNHSSNSDKEGY